MSIQWQLDKTGASTVYRATSGGAPVGGVIRNANNVQRSRRWCPWIVTGGNGSRLKAGPPFPKLTEAKHWVETQYQRQI